MDRIAKYKAHLIHHVIEIGDLPCDKKDVMSFLFFCDSTFKLTYHGFKYMKKHFKHYCFEYDDKDMKCKHLYNMETSFNAPYYKSAKNIYLFSKKDTFIVRLHGNDVHCFLDRGFDGTQE